MVLSSPQLLLSGSDREGPLSFFRHWFLHTPPSAGIGPPVPRRAGIRLWGHSGGWQGRRCVLESRDQDALLQWKHSTEPSDCHLWSLGVFLDAVCHMVRGSLKVHEVSNQMNQLWRLHLSPWAFSNISPTPHKIEFRSKPECVCGFREAYFSFLLPKRLLGTFSLVFTSLKSKAAQRKHGNSLWVHLEISPPTQHWLREF